LYFYIFPKNKIKYKFHFNRITRESRGFFFPTEREKMKTRSHHHHHYHHHNPNSPRYLWGVGVEKTRKRTTREKRKNVNEPAGSSSSSFYPSRVGALRQKETPSTLGVSVTTLRDEQPYIPQSFDSFWRGEKKILLLPHTPRSRDFSSSQVF
jgi:hypothetical protein